MDSHLHQTIRTVIGLISKFIHSRIVWFCVLGSTSSGKSTLLNALLGEHLLPIDHNASTAVLCEIKYSHNGKKYAKIHFEGDQEVEQLELESYGGRQQLASHVKRGGTALLSCTPVCTFVEIFWPQNFLKVGHLFSLN